MTDDQPIVLDIEIATNDNPAYRNVIATSNDMQLVLMTILPGEEIGAEIHDTTQFIRIEDGTGLSILDNVEYDLAPNIALFIPPGTKHNIINTSLKPLKLYTLYAKPVHGVDDYFMTKEEEEAVLGEHESSE